MLYPLKDDELTGVGLGDVTTWFSIQSSCNLGFRGPVNELLLLLTYPCRNAVYFKYTLKQLEKYTLFVLKVYFKYTLRSIL